MKRRNRRPAKRPIGRIFERLEGRYCLTVAAAVTDGNLVVAGDADVSSYVERLETRFDTADDGPGWLETDDEVAADDDEADDDDDWFDEDELPSGESLAEDFERYLRDQPDE